MPKALITASVSSMIDQFCRQNIDVLEKLGYRVFVAANFSSGSPTSIEQIKKFKELLIERNIEFYDIPFYRKIYSFDNLKAYFQLKKIINNDKYDIIHTQSPVGGVITRLAAFSSRRKGAKVIYTAHGFHFFKGASIKNWLLFFPVELICSFLTDTLVTINNEDFRIAFKRFKSKKIINFPYGVGVNSNNYRIEVDKNKYLSDFNIPKDSFIITSIGELSVRKNHEVIIRAIAKLRNDKIYYIICGIGELESYLKELSFTLNISNNVIFAGFRNDRLNFLKISNIFAFPSLQEGLPVALMEAMSVGLPIVCSNVRGNNDLVENEKGGFVIDPYNYIEFAAKLELLKRNPNLVHSMGAYNLKNIKSFDYSEVEQNLKALYLSDTK